MSRAAASVPPSLSPVARLCAAYGLPEITHDESTLNAMTSSSLVGGRPVSPRPWARRVRARKHCWWSATASWVVQRRIRWC